MSAECCIAIAFVSPLTSPMSVADDDDSLHPTTTAAVAFTR
jgi:hypothetical protein